MQFIIIMYSEIDESMFGSFAVTITPVRKLRIRPVLGWVAAQPYTGSRVVFWVGGSFNDFPIVLRRFVDRSRCTWVHWEKRKTDSRLSERRSTTCGNIIHTRKCRLRAILLRSCIRTWKLVQEGRQSRVSQTGWAGKNPHWCIRIKNSENQLS